MRCTYDRFWAEVDRPLTVWEAREQRDRDEADLEALADAAMEASE